MNMYKKIPLLVLLFTVINSFSQKHELGNVTIAELEEKASPIDSSAAAAYLFNVGRTYFEYDGDDGFYIMTEIITKIKIYKKEGYENANQFITYYNNGGRSERVDFSKAITYNLINGKIEKTKLSSSGEFEEKLNKYNSRKKITLPNVKEGSIIEYKVTIKSPFFSNFPEWEFQKEIPVAYSEYTTNIPEYFTYNLHQKGYYNLITENSSKTRSVEYTYVDNSKINFNGDKTGRVRGTLTFKENSVKYSITNVSAIKDEGYVNNVENYQSMILHELAGIRYPNEPYKSFATDWDAVTKNIYENENFGSELKKTGYFEKDIDALLNDVTNPEERLAKVVTYVKSKMYWNKNNAVLCTDGVKKAYQEGKGNAAEINLMLTSMLRYAGFEANPVLLSTRSNGISLFPSRTAFNYAICGVEYQNSIYLLDATTKYSVPNILPIRDLNWFGRLIRKNGTSEQINLTPKMLSKDIVNIICSINNQGEVTGKIREQHYDYYAYVFRETFNPLTKESYVEKLEKRHQGLEIKDYEVLNKEDLGSPITENYSFTSTNSVEIIGDKLYFSPFLYLATTKNPFKQEKREYPVDFVFPTSDRFNVSITIPEGYVVETLPQPKAVSMPNNMGIFKYNISNTEDKIQLVYTFEMNEAIVNPADYEIIKNFYKEMVLKQTEKIVIKKG